MLGVGCWVWVLGAFRCPSMIKLVGFTDFGDPHMWSQKRVTLIQDMMTICVLYVRLVYVELCSVALSLERSRFKLHWSQTRESPGPSRCHGSLPTARASTLSNISLGPLRVTITATVPVARALPVTV